MSNDKETVVVSDGGRGGGGGGWFIAGIVVVVLIILGFLYFNGTFSGGSSGSGDVELNVEAPEVPTPEVDVVPDGE